MANKSQPNFPSSFKIATANVTIPALTVLTPAMIQLGQISVIGLGFFKAILILASIFSGVTSLLSFVIVFVPYGHALIQWTMIISQVSSQLQAGTTIQFTIMILILNYVIMKYASILGVVSSSGGSTKFLVAVWLSFVFTMVAAIYWQIVWTVETRRSSFKKRLRTQTEMGNYKGIITELKEDLKRPATGDWDEMDERLLKISNPLEVYSSTGMRKRSTQAQLSNYV